MPAMLVSVSYLAVASRERRCQKKGRKMSLCFWHYFHFPGTKGACSRTWTCRSAMIDVSPAAHAFEPDVLVRCTPAGTTTAMRWAHTPSLRLHHRRHRAAIFAASAVATAVAVRRRRRRADPSPRRPAAAPTRSCRHVVVHEATILPYARTPVPLTVAGSWFVCARHGALRVRPGGPVWCWTAPRTPGAKRKASFSKDSAF